jgi:type IV pilus assembly protein PilC
MSATTFQYKVRDNLGKQHAGEMEAENRDEAAHKLRHDGFHILNLEEEEESLNLFPKRVKKSDIIYATAQLAIMVDTGITLSSAIAGIAEQEDNPAFRTLLNDLKNRVEGGEDFSSALAQHPKYFDKTFISMVKASEHTGTLGEMLERVATYLRNELETRAKVRAALAYPGVMAALAICVTIFLLTFVLPKFTPLFERKGMKLPTPTIIMMTLSHALIDYWWAWLVGGAVIGLTYWFGRKTVPGRKVIDWFKINAPIVGVMFRKVTISRSIRTLGTMIQSGVSMLEAIRLTSEVSGNIYYEQSWNRVLDEITQGNRICEALQGDPLFPKTLIQMIAAGEETGQLDFVLQKVSVYYDREVEMSLKTATSMIEPIMITIMGVVVGGIGLGLMLPIFQLSRGG